MVCDSFLDNPFVGYAYHRVILDQKGNPVDYEFLEINDAFERLTGLKRENVINRTVKEVIPEIESDPFNWIEFFGNIAINGGSAETEQYSAKLGRWYKVYAYSDEPMYFKVLFIDITKQKDAEINLALEKKKLEKIIESTQAGLFEWDLKTGEIKLCFGCPEKLGYSIDELEPVNFSVFEKLVHPEDMPEVAKAIDRNLKGETEFYQCDFRMKHKDGHWVWFSGRGGVTERDRDGKPLKFAGVNIDITWRKKLEEEILHHKNRLQLLIDGLPFPVWLVNRDRKILYQNKKAETVLKTKIGEYCWNTLHRGITLPEAERKIFIEKGEISKGAKCYYCRGDEALDKKTAVNDLVEIYGRVWDFWWVYIDENIYLHYALDVTDKIKLRDEILKTDRFRAVGELAAGIAHEFNNLLQAIMGNIELALLYSEDKNGKKHLSNALISLDQAKTLANKLITFSKGGEPLMVLMPLSPWIKDVTIFYSQSLNFEPIFNIPDDLYLIKLDPEQMESVIANLIKNSYEAKPKDLIISISAENVYLERANPYSLKEGKYVKITFSDNGPGIPKDNLNKIFDLFFTTKEGSSGLGLSISYSIVKRHGGIMDVESEPGKGTKFFIYLPAQS